MFTKLDERSSRELSQAAHPHGAASEFVKVAHYQEEIGGLLDWKETATRDVNACNRKRGIKRRSLVSNIVEWIGGQVIMAMVIRSNLTMVTLSRAWKRHFMANFTPRLYYLWQKFVASAVLTTAMQVYEYQDPTI